MNSWYHSHSRSRYLHVSAIVTFYRYALTEFSCFKLSSGMEYHYTKLSHYSIPTPHPPSFPVLVLYSILYSSSNLFKRYQPDFHSSTYKVTPLLHHWQCLWLTSNLSAKANPGTAGQLPPPYPVQQAFLLHHTGHARKRRGMAPFFPQQQVPHFHPTSA